MGNPWQGIILPLLLLLVSCAPAAQINKNVPEKCDQLPPDVYTINGFDTNAEVTYGKFVKGKIDIKSNPQVFNLASKVASDARIRDHLRCLAKYRDKYNAEQVAYYDALNSFMATSPTPEDFLKWQKTNKFPSTNIKDDNKGIPKCIDGPTHSNGPQGGPGYVGLIVKPVSTNWWFVAVSQNRPDSVWVQQPSRPDVEGRLILEAYGFKGRYGVYATSDDETINKFRELSKQSAMGQKITIHDLPKGAILICTGVAVK